MIFFGVSNVDAKIPNRKKSCQKSCSRYQVLFRERTLKNILNDIYSVLTVHIPNQTLKSVIGKCSLTGGQIEI